MGATKVAAAAPFQWNLMHPLSVNVDRSTIGNPADSVRASHCLPMESSLNPCRAFTMTIGRSSPKPTSINMRVGSQWEQTVSLKPTEEQSVGAPKNKHHEGKQTNKQTNCAGKVIYWSWTPGTTITVDRSHHCGESVKRIWGGGIWSFKLDSPDALMSRRPWRSRLIQSVLTPGHLHWRWHAAARLGYIPPALG